MITIKNDGNNHQATTDKVAAKVGKLAEQGIKHSVAAGFGFFQGAKHAFQTYKSLTK